MRFLVIQTGTIGDILFSTMLLRCLKVQLDADLTVLTTRDGKMVLEENPYLEQTMIFEFSHESIRVLRKNQFDFILDLDASFRSRVISLALTGKVKRFSKHRFGSFMLTRFKINQLYGTNLALQYVNLVKDLGVRADDIRLDYFVPFKFEVPSEWLPEDFRRKFVVFSINAPYETRKLPVSRIIEACDKINKPVILIGDKGDSVVGKAVEDFFSKSEKSSEFEAGLRSLNKKTIVYNACGKFNFHQQASLIKKASHVITFDNDHLPVASAFGKETFSIYGNTVLSFGRFPYQTRYTILENSSLQCRPCSSKGHLKCPLGHFKCIKNISLDFYVA